MKHLKYFEANIDFDNWDEEEEDPYDIEELKKQRISFTTDDQCIEIAKKLKNMDFEVYNYDDVIETGMSAMMSDDWSNFTFNVNPQYWVRSRHGKEFIDYKTFMKNY